MAARKVWKVSVSHVALFGRVLETTDSAWIELPADEGFTLIAGEEVVLAGGMKAILSHEISAILSVQASLVLHAKDGSAACTLELPKGTMLQFAEKTVQLQPVTHVKAGTKITWPGVRLPDSPSLPEHGVVDHDTKQVVFWLPAAGGLTIDHGDAQLRFPSSG